MAALQLSGLVKFPFADHWEDFENGQHLPLVLKVLVTQSRFESPEIKTK